MTIEERVRPAATFKPEVASLNMGSMNFGLYPMLERQKEFKHDWERPYLEGSRERIFKNTFKDIEYILTTCAENGTRFEIECYDIGHLYTLCPLRRSRPGQAALLRPDGVRHPRRHRPASRGRRAHEAHRRPAVRRSVPLVGARRRTQPAGDRHAAAAMGGNVRVGLEDSLWIGPGQLAKTNAGTQERQCKVPNSTERETQVASLAPTTRWTTEVPTLSSRPIRRMPIPRRRSLRM